MKQVIIEIGFEELPASYLKRGLDELSIRIETLLKEHLIAYKNIKAFYTNRRYIISFFSEFKGHEREEEIKGPPKHIAYSEGKLTKAGKSFLQKLQIEEKDTFIKKQGKSEYLYAKIKKQGETLPKILSNIPGILESIEYPRKMSWGRSILFPRPIRWITTVYDNTSIPISMDVYKELTTFVNRFEKKEKQSFSNAEEFFSVLERGHVIYSYEERKNKIYNELKEAGTKLNGKVILDEELIEEIVNIVEYPVLIEIKFDKRFSSLPTPLVVTALKKHQRAFSITDSQGNTLPYAYVFANNPHVDSDLAKKWHARMIASRLEDAKFFFEEDLRMGLESMVEEGKKVVWIKNAGTLYEKAERLMRLAELFYLDLNIDKETIKKAAHFAKADLVSNVVREKEFTSLQGIMGGIYAEAQKEDENVKKAIYHHYETKPIDNKYAAALSIFDKIDNISGGFYAKMLPKGSYDPLALKRQADAIIVQIIHMQFNLSLASLIKEAIKPFSDELYTPIKTFLLEREKNYFIKSFPYDHVNAILNVTWENIYDVYLRLNAFEKYLKHKASGLFKEVAVGQKRLANIVKKVKEKTLLKTSLFEQKEEKELFDAYNKIKEKVINSVKNKNYLETLDYLLTLKPYIDRFFDNVFVMVEDNSIKNNRLALLTQVRELFLFLADFSEIVVET